MFFKIKILNFFLEVKIIKKIYILSHSFSQNFIFPLSIVEISPFFHLSIPICTFFLNTFIIFSPKPTNNSLFYTNTCIFCWTITLSLSLSESLDSGWGGGFLKNMLLSERPVWYLNQQSINQPINNINGSVSHHHLYFRLRKYIICRRPDYKFECVCKIQNQ